MSCSDTHTQQRSAATGRNDCGGGSNSASRGFTLVELMVTVALAAIVLAFAVPAFTDLVQRNRRAQTLNNLVSHMQAARAEAAKRRVSVSLCPSTDGTTCAASGTGWQAGWIAWVECDANFGTVDSAEQSPAGTTNCDGHAPVMLARQNAVDGPTISSNDFGDFVTFGPSGRVRTSSSGNRGGRILYCPSSSTEAERAVAVAPTGSPRVEKLGGGTTCP